MSVSEPPVRLGKLSERERNAIMAEISAGTSLGRAWKEKLRLFSSLYGRRLAKEGRSRFGVESLAHMAWIAEALCVPDPGAAKPSAAGLNGALFAADATNNDGLKTDVRERAVELRNRLLVNKSTDNASSPLGASFMPSADTWKQEAVHVDPVVIICPMHNSIYTLAVMELCRRYGVPIAGVILRKLDLARFRQEFSRDGMRLFRKIWRKLILRSDENREISTVSLKTVFDRLDCGFSDVRAFSRHMDVPVFEVVSLSEPPIELEGAAAATALFTGGGLIGKSLLEHFSNGIINVHLGALPQYKGMDVVQAPILDGCFDSIGMSAHLMAPGLDEGPVVSVFTTSSDSYRSLGALRNEMSALSPLMAFDACLGLASGRYDATPQPDQGCQYFIVHSVLNEIISDVLAKRFVHTEGASGIEKLVGRVLPKTAG